MSLVEAGPRILAAFPEHLSVYANSYLENIGVEVRTGRRVMDIRASGADIEGEFVPAGSIIWGAGVMASSAHSWLGITGVAGGRIPVDDDLRVIGFDDIYAIGDTSALAGPDGKLLPLSRRSPSNKEHTLDKVYDPGEPYQSSSSRTEAIRR